MNDFFNNLVGRHLGTCVTIKPRTPGRYETEHGGRGLELADADMDALVSDVDLRTGTFQESDLTGPGRVDVTSPRPSQDARQEIGSYHQSKPESSDTLYQFAELAPGTHPPRSGVDKRNIDSMLNHRVRAVLQRLGSDFELPAAQLTPDEQSQPQDARQVSTSLADKKALLNTDEVSLDSESASNRQTDISDSEGAGNAALYTPLAPPSWLAEIESRFNTRMKDVEAQAEPVINVNIGRVEVRAIQTGSAEKVKRVKKPTGVMPLEEYQKQRRGEGVK